MLCFEIAAGEYPFGEYPAGYENGQGDLSLDLDLITAVGMPRAFAALLQRMVSRQPGARPALDEVFACLATMPCG